VARVLAEPLYFRHDGGQSKVKLNDRCTPAPSSSSSSLTSKLLRSDQPPTTHRPPSTETDLPERHEPVNVGPAELTTRPHLLLARAGRLLSSAQFKNNFFTEMCSGSEAGSHLRLIYFVSLNSRLECNKEEEVESGAAVHIRQLWRGKDRGEGLGFRV